MTANWKIGGSKFSSHWEMTHLQSIWFNSGRQRQSIGRGLMEVRWHCRRWLGERWQMGSKIKEDGGKWRRILLEDRPTVPVSMRWSNRRSEGDANASRRAKVTLIFFHLSLPTNRVSLTDTFPNPACLHSSGWYRLWQIQTLLPSVGQTSTDAQLFT